MAENIVNSRAENGAFNVQKRFEKSTIEIRRKRYQQAAAFVRIKMQKSVG